MSWSRAQGVHCRPATFLQVKFRMKKILDVDSGDKAGHAAKVDMTDTTDDSPVLRTGSETRRVRVQQSTLKEELTRADGLKAETERLRAEVSKLRALQSSLREERARADEFAGQVDLLKAELRRLTNSVGFRLGRSLGRIISWNRYDAAYQVWKEFKRGNIGRDEALEIIGDEYGVRAFFLLYPLYKIAKPFQKLKRRLTRVLSREKTGDPGKPITKPDGTTGGTEVGTIAPPFDPAKKTILIVSHEASQTGAPILAFNLLEKFIPRYNVVSVLLKPGKLEDAFKNVSSKTIGPFRNQLHYPRSIYKPILRACQQYSPAFAIVNSLESREALVPISEAGVPVILLVHEFASLYPQKLDMRSIAKLAGKIVFPARRVWEDAVAVYPWLEEYPANIANQGQVRIPREWLGGLAADDEEERIAAVMRPLGRDDDERVVIGCGYLDVRKGIDLFVSTAAALQRRKNSRRYRFVWVGKESRDVYTCYITVQVDCSGLQETVKFLGEVNSLDSVYAMADIFLLSSRLDPFPNVAIDAMLAGLPVVCFRNASGVAELLSNHVDLKHLVVPYADASSAAEVIEQLCNHSAHLQTTKAAIRNLALSTFDMDRYVERLEQLAEESST